MSSINTPVNPEKLERLLIASDYDHQETKFLVNGFKHGFTIGYNGPIIRKNTARNIPFQPGIGNKVDMWNKIMKEVESKRLAGPFDFIPFSNYIQSPIGLVPKAGGKTRLIFHLSSDFPGQSGGRSLNHHTPKELCTVKYNDLDAAVQACLRMSTNRCQNRLPIFLAKSDLMSAFRMLPIIPDHYCWLVMKCEDPATGRVMFFVDKCLPFGASISCAHFQRFSNALRHLVEHITGRKQAVINYLDDFLFIDTSIQRCNYLVRSFLTICETINLPVSLDKTEWAAPRLIFLGILLDGATLTLSIPIDKRNKALKMLQHFMDKKKATVKELQRLTGYLNFLTKAIFPGRAFTRRMYSKYSLAIAKPQSQFRLKHYHHVKLDQEFKFDCEVWRIFLSGSLTSIVARPMVDLSSTLMATQLNFYTDASANENLGIGGVFNNQWLFSQWEPGYINQYQPSIAYLELYGVCAAVLTWGWQLKNLRMVVYCDNASVVHMINQSTSSCKNCMYLIKLLTLSGLRDNRRVFARHVSGINNSLADSLSRLHFTRFWAIAPTTMSPEPTPINPIVWPASKNLAGLSINVISAVF